MVQRMTRHPATAEAAAKAIVVVGLEKEARVVAAVETDKLAGSVEKREQEIAVETLVIEEATTVETTIARMGTAVGAVVARGREAAPTREREGSGRVRLAA
mmetsp:Transcript_49982/g.99267  ORF Transcript_49982/g.99267 Transcript_49982/m.99267 type:complete len:101 (+) Transcript_49982:608-910(+)